MREWCRYAFAVGVFGLALIAENGCADSPDRRVARVMAWERSGTPDAIEALRRAASDPASEVRAGAIRALLKLGVPEASEIAGRALEDESADVRSSAALASGEGKVQGVSGALAKRLASDSDPGVRRAAAQALGSLGTEEVVPALTAALEDPVSEVRLSAARALSALAGAAAVDALARRLTEEPEWEVRAEVARALGRAQIPLSYVPLRAALADPNEFVRAAASGALRELRGAGVPESSAVPESPAYGPAMPRSRAPSSGTPE